MPELPEVQTVVDTLRGRLLKMRIERVQLSRRDIVHPLGTDLSARLRRRTIDRIIRRGKRIIVGLDDGNCLYFHLGMTGQLTIESPGRPLRSHTHLVISCQLPVAGSQRRDADAHSGNSVQLHFRDPRRFGGIWWIGKDRAPDQGLGPEPLTLRPQQLIRRLSGARRPIKNALLDQTLIAGLGNIYADEALFRARIHPLTRADQLSPAQAAGLNRSIKYTLRHAIRHKGSSLRDYVDGNGQSGSFQNLHRVYGRESRPCRTCRTSIQRIVLAGRSTHFCPTCQPGES